MYLKSLEIQGFKSFPDKTVLEFKDGIAAVVGPNGSGKSNISDAMRWVLGEQSSKTLRGAKMEDVIFSGTRRRSAMSFASVAIVLDNKDRALDIDSDEVVIARRYYRSGESEYSINKQNVRLRDIHQLLMDTGLGRDGYAIIGQGKIAEIVGAKSDSRREIFEEAAGISKYRYRKEEAAKQLARAEDNLLRLSDIMSELESRVEPLRIQSEKAEKFLKLAQRKKSVEISIWNDTLNKSKNIIKEFEDKLYLANLDREKLNEDLAGSEAEIERIFNDMQGLSAENDRLSTAKTELNNVISENKSKIAVLNNDISHFEQNIIQLKNQIDNFDIAAKETAIKLDSKNSDKEELILQLANFNIEKDKLDSEILEIKTGEESNSALQRELMEKVSGFTKSAAESNVKIYSAKSTITEIDANIAETNTRLVQLGNQIADANDVAQDAKDIVDSIIDNLTQLENSAEGGKMILGLRTEKLEKVSDSKDEILTQINNVSHKIKILQDMENAMEGFSFSVKNIIKEGRNGRINGINGVLSSLISVDKENAVAIETALGAAMQNIVVENEDIAKRCVAFLKQNKSGRATFLPISSVKPRGNISENLDSFLGFVGIAAELVNTDVKYKGIISNLLSRTAVVEDIDTAVKIAKKYGYKFRIVTLDGQIINAGGSITGGSTVRNSGILGRSGEIAKLRGNKTAYEGKLAEIDERLQKAKSEYDLAAAEWEGIDAEIKTATEEKVKAEYNFAVAGATYENLVTAQNRNKQDIALLKDRKNDIEGEIARLEAEHTSHNEEIDTLTTKLTELSGKSQDVASSIQGRSEALANLRMDILSKERDIQAVEKEIEILTESAQSAKGESVTINAQIDEAKVKSDALVSEINSLQMQNGDTAKQIEDKDLNIKANLEKRNSLEKTSIDIRASVKSSMDNREGVSRDIAKLEERLNTAKEEYDSIIANLWEEYELTRAAAKELAFDIEDLQQTKKELAELRSKIRGLGSVNVSAIEEYKEVSERYTFMKAQIDDIEKSKRELTKLVNNLTDEMKTTFLDNFNKISKHFSKVFVELFGGGAGRLELTDPDNILESGIDIFVEPPGKIIKNLAALSGGEQAFVAIAIYFAILKVRPSPFCVLDEIEAALDDVNVYKFAEYLRKINKRTQFVCITHRRGTMEEADKLYGVTMQENGISKILSLDVTQIEDKLGIK